MKANQIRITRQVWELVELCAEKRGRCSWVNLSNFRDALDSREIGRKETYAALRDLEENNYLITMTRGEDDEITDIVITPPTYRCNDCRLIVSSRQDWEDHLPLCLRQREKLRKLGILPRGVHQV